MSLFQWTPYERAGVNGWSTEFIVGNPVFLSFLSVILTAIYLIFLALIVLIIPFVEKGTLNTEARKASPLHRE